MFFLFMWIQNLIDMIASVSVFDLLHVREKFGLWEWNGIVDRDGKYTDTWRGMACGCGLV